MHLRFHYIYNILSKIKEKINKILINFFVNNEMHKFLCFLLIVNLRKIKQIKPQNHTKFKAIVLSKSGGLEDLIYSQKKYNKNILYLNCPRYFFADIFLAIAYGLGQKNIKNYIKKKENINSKEIREIEIVKKKYSIFLINFLKILKKKYNFQIFIGFNFNYSAEKDLHKVCTQLRIPFLLLLKESVITEIEKDYFIHALKKQKEKFNGYKVAVYSNFAKKFLIESNLIDQNNKVEVVGCSRLSASFLYKKKIPKNQILYYAIQNNRGLPNRFIKKFGNRYFNDLKKKEPYNSKYNWNILHKKTLRILKKFAIKNPEILISIKTKTGDLYDKKQYLHLPKNIKVHHSGTGHKLLENSKIIIAWNTTSILEGIASNRLILLPYFHKKSSNLKKRDELILKLKNKNYGYSENDFYKKNNYFVKKKYIINKVYNNQYSLKYYLGNEDNKANLRLNNFIQKNLSYKD